MQAIILVLGAKILINLHQPLNLFFGAQYMEHFLSVAKNIVFHEAKHFVIAGSLAGLKEGKAGGIGRNCSDSGPGSFQNRVHH